MDNNPRWRPQDQYFYHQEPPEQPQQNIRYGSAAADSVHHAQGLLAVYPMASATPTNHAVRHMNNMYTTAAPPTFAQPSYYAPRTSYSPQGNPPPYSEYDHQVRYLSSPQPPVNDGGYWATARDNAVRILADQPASSYRYPAQQTWRPPQGPVSSFQPSPFAQSVFQRTAPPNNAYPTPSPPVMQTSSSSLAHALGPPPHAPQRHPDDPRPPPPQKVYRPEESRAFFNTFLEQKTREMKIAMQPRSQPVASPLKTPAPAKAPAPVKASVPAKTPVPVKTPVTKFAAASLNQPSPQSSPDPLSIMTYSSPVPVTPRKRKPVVEIESPSLKRLQTMRDEYVLPTQRSSASASSVPTTPNSNPAASANSQGSTPTPKHTPNFAYVSVPRPTWATPYTRPNGFITPSMSRKKFRIDDESPDLGGYGPVDGDGSPIKRRNIMDSAKSSVRRTGDRDDRAPLEKFLCLIEDIFDSEDALPAEINANDLPDYFSSLSLDSSQPHLHSNHIRKLTKYIGQVARPNQRLRNTTAGVMNTPRAQGRMAQIDTQVLSRLLKVLSRSVKAGEDLDPFKYVAPSAGPPKSSPRKKTAKAKKPDISQSLTAKGDSDDITGQDSDRRSAEEEDREPEMELTSVDHKHLTRSLQIARESILAADCCIALLGSDRLTKQLYSEELIISCFNAVKNQLEKIIYPFVETSTGMAFDFSGNPILRFVVQDNSSTASSHRKQLSELFQALSSVIPRINNLVNAETVAMSDTIIISAVYIAIGPFFIVEGENESKGKKEKDNVILKTFGKSAMRGLRLDALGLIRSIFANNESQRSWIIEEILTSLIKLSDTKQKAGSFRLRDGRSIRTVSALLLQLVQTSAHDVRLKAKKIEKNRQNQLALKRQESFSESQQAQELFLDENDHEEIVLYKGGLDSAMQAAKTIIGFLTKRSGKGKITKNSNEAEYRAIFDNLIGDLLVVLFWPEWPAAGVLLTMICRYMVNALSDKHVNAQIDSNAAKTMALDHLGVIAARIRSATLKFQVKADEEVKVRPLKSMDEIVDGQDIMAFERLLKAHRDITTHIARRSSEDQAYDSARELSAAIVGQELATALQQLQKWIEMPELDDDLDLKARDTNKMLTFGRKIRGALRDVWKDPPTDVFDVGSQEEVDRIDQLGEQIGTLQAMRSSFDPILNTIVASLNAPVIFIRTKALRALGQIVTSDPAVLSMPIVRRGIENHLLDSSPAVRDAAVELIGKYMIDSPEVAGNYYQKIADRMADTGLSVRKRVIKLLKSFYSVTQDNNCKIDIATRMVARMMDEDDTVKELAIKTIEELWFPTAPTTSVNTRIKSASADHNQSDKNSILAKVIVIMGTAAHFKERQSPLEDLLHKIMAEKPENEVPALHARYSEICGTLIDGLVDATDMPGFTVVNCIRTIYLFTSAYPPVLSGSNASTLLPYLKSTSSNEELITTDYLLKVFRVSIPHMSPTAGKFGQDLQLALQPMIIKPSGSGGVQILQEAVGCMCVVVQHLTHDFIRLVNLLKSCNARLQQAIKRPITAQMEDKETRPLVILILIVALLGEHCQFDQLRSENTDIAKDIDAISKGSITEHIYDTLLQLYQKYHSTPMLRGRTLQCLGFLFRAQPTLMTKERSASIMDAIFASPEEDGKGRLLRIMQEFLVSESEKNSAKLKETTKAKSSKPTNVNMDELVGNTDDFADSGVSSAIVQRYLDQVLEAALSPASPNQGAAVDVLSFTIKQGLAHPLQSFPVIVALETSPVTSLSNRATALHSILQGKHASLINTRYIVSARASFEYQKKIAGSQEVKGYRTEPSPVALLQRWFSLVREKRVQRQEFLKSLVKVFQENSDYQSTQDDVDFMRYMAENFAMFDYKTQEEVITVIKHLTVVLSTSGMHLLEMISPSHLLSQLHAPLETAQESAPQTNPDTNAMVIDPPEPQTIPTVPIPVEDSLDKLPLMRTSVIIAMVMLLKAHLKSLYSISEEKCNKFVVGKKSAAGDKPVTKRNDKPISWNRLPYATSPMLTTEDIKVQKARFLDIWNEDGVTAEPDDELEFA